MDGITLGLLASMAMPAETSDYNGYSAHAAGAFVEYKNIRLTGGYEIGEHKLLGQTMGDFNAFTVEGGYRHEFSKQFSVYGGVGYWHPSISSNALIVDEVAFTWLVNNHRNDGRPIPLNASDTDYKYHGCDSAKILGYYEAVSDICHGSSYYVDPAPYVRIAAKYQFNSWAGLSLEYRFLRPQGSIEIWRDGSYDNPKDWVAATGPQGWWREDGFMNFDTVVATFEISF